MWTLSDKEAFERSVTQAIPRGEMVAKAVMQKFLSEVQLYGSGASPSPISVESIWRHGKIAVRYRLRSSTQQVEVLSVAVTGSEPASCLIEKGYPSGRPVRGSLPHN